MKALIFDRLEIGWDELRPDSNWPPSLHFAALLKNPEKVELGTFPTAGRPRDGSNVSDIVVTADGMKFPSFGDWYVWCQIGIWKLHLCNRSDSEEDQVLKLCTFVAANSWHSAADFHLASPVNRNWPLDLTRAWEKLFYSDQPVAFHCGQIVALLCRVLHAAGYSSRVIWLKNAKGNSHLVAEVWLPKARRWLFVDPDLGAVFRAGHLLSLEEICSGHPFTWESFAFRFLSHKYNMQLGFVGQITWRPEYMYDPTPAVMQRRREQYLSNVLGGVAVVESKFSGFESLDIAKMRIKGWESGPVSTGAVLLASAP